MDKDTSWCDPREEDLVAAWFTPTDKLPLTAGEMKIRESMERVHMAQDLVPFWLRGVKAAERGQALKMERFLDELQSGKMEDWLPSSTANQATSTGTPRQTEEHERTATDSIKKMINDLDGTSWDDGYVFVEDMARQASVDAAKKERMHSFFKMSTAEKVGKINEHWRFVGCAHTATVDAAYPSLIPEPAYMRVVFARFVRASGFVVVAAVA
ncbi:hypothetical protein AX17_000246 [Amanita inopinata Kibby_2008]|nr:hypothetical protein AX17_000246 [Amanita inopinata Kibby_2008]